VAFHCNQWRLLRRCVEVRTAIELSFGVVSGVDPGIHVLDGSPRAQGEEAVSGMVSDIFRKFDRILYNAEMAY